MHRIVRNYQRECARAQSHARRDRTFLQFLAHQSQPNRQFTALPRCSRPVMSASSRSNNATSASPNVRFERARSAVLRTHEPGRLSVAQTSSSPAKTAAVRPGSAQPVSPTTSTLNVKTSVVDAVVSLSGGRSPTSASVKASFFQDQSPPGSPLSGPSLARAESFLDKTLHSPPLIAKQASVMTLDMFDVTELPSLTGVGGRSAPAADASLSSLEHKYDTA